MRIFKRIGIIFMACFMVIGMTGCSKTPKIEKPTKADIRNYEKQNILSDYIWFWKAKEKMNKSLAGQNIDVMGLIDGSAQLSEQQTKALNKAGAVYMKDLYDHASKRDTVEKDHLQAFDEDYLDHLALVRAYITDYKKDKQDIEDIASGKSSKDVMSMPTFTLALAIYWNTHKKIDVPVQKIQEARNSVKQ